MDHGGRPTTSDLGAYIKDQIVFICCGQYFGFNFCKGKC